MSMGIKVLGNSSLISQGKFPAPWGVSLRVVVRSEGKIP